jgi:proton glutamate symport protein
MPLQDSDNTGAAGQGKFALVSIRLPVALTFAALVGGLGAGIVGAMAGAPRWSATSRALSAACGCARCR